MTTSRRTFFGFVAALVVAPLAAVPWKRPVELTKKIFWLEPDKSPLQILAEMRSSPMRGDQLDVTCHLWT